MIVMAPDTGLVFPMIPLGMTNLRRFQPHDIDAVMALYRHSIRTLGIQEYTEEQVRIWSHFPVSREAFLETLLEGVTILSEVDGVIASFGQLNPPDHIAYLFCAPEYARSGHASSVYLQLEADARAQGEGRLRTEASRIARPFFEKQGYSIIETEEVLHHEIGFERFKMEKKI